MGINVNAQKKSTAKTTKSTTTASSSSKATKQETMDWIAGKMKENLAYPRKFVSYENGIITWSKEMGGGGISHLCTSSLNLNKVTGMSNEYSDDVFISGKSLNPSQCTGEQNPTIYEYVSISGPDYNEYGAPFDFTTDKSLSERMKKALMTLVEYNGSKKTAGEKF